MLRRFMFSSQDFLMCLMILIQMATVLALPHSTLGTQSKILT